MYVITGGGSGIGRALAHALALRGKKVLVVGRRADNLSDVADFSPLISTLVASVSTSNGRDTLINCLNDEPVIDGLIHNAGTISPIAPLAELTEDDWQNAMATHVEGPLFITQRLLDKLKNGRVLMISTGVAYFPVANWAAYCVSKAALSMLTQCWQLESTSTAFASVLPGIVDTDMQTCIRHSPTMSSEQVDFYKSLQQQGRLLQPSVVAQFLAWLLLDISKAELISEVWDIYNTKHHSLWLTYPNEVPHWDNQK